MNSVTVFWMIVLKLVGMTRQSLVGKTGISRQLLSAYARKKSVMMPEALFPIATAIGCTERA